MPTCTTGTPVQLTCTVSGNAPAVVHVCEVSGQLGVGVACTLADAKANVIVGTTPTPVSFACPVVRDAAIVADASGSLIPTTLPSVGAYSLHRARLGTLGVADATPPPAAACTGA